jgi:hypothetical protein
MPEPSPKQQRETLERLERFSYWTDSNFRVPFTPYRFGISPLLGLLPGIGDFAGLVLSLYVLLEARKVGASRRVQLRIIRNMLIEFFVGLFPLLGDVFDAVFKANTRNTNLLKRYLEEQLEIEQKPPFPWGMFITLSVLFALLLWLLWWIW